MKSSRQLPEKFLSVLHLKDDLLVDLYMELRETILITYPAVNELLYYTHALTSVFTVSEKMSDGFCLIPIYKEHLNFGFQRGMLLNDVDNLLEGTGKLMRHIPVRRLEDFKKEAVFKLIEASYELAITDAGKNVALEGLTISKLR